MALMSNARERSLPSGRVFQTFRKRDSSHLWTPVWCIYGKQVPAESAELGVAFPSGAAIPAEMARTGFTKKSRGRGGCRRRQIKQPTNLFKVHCSMDGSNDVDVTLPSSEAAWAAAQDWLYMTGSPVLPHKDWEVWSPCGESGGFLPSILFALVKHDDMGDPVNGASAAIHCAHEFKPYMRGIDRPGGFQARGPRNGYISIARLYI